MPPATLKTPASRGKGLGLLLGRGLSFYPKSKIMNIQNYLGSSFDEIGPMSRRDRVGDMITTRMAVFTRFGELEVTNRGRAQIFMPLWSKAGQDVARNFLMRSLEEVMEAADSLDPDHVKEELIDSLFYLISIWVMDPGLNPTEDLPDFLTSVFNEIPSVSWGQGAKVTYHFSEEFLWAMSRFLETLRNRTWQRSVQQPYFNGLDSFKILIWTWMREYLPLFDSEDQFFAFCKAKHQVLIFRLDTNY